MRRQASGSGPALPAPDDVAADQEALRDAGGLTESRERTASTVSRAVPLHAPDDLRFTEVDLGLYVVAGVGFEPT